MVDLETFYRDHWIDIEDERLARYNEVFKVNDTNRSAWLSQLNAQPGETVLDFGCGPGYIAVELAKIVGGGGHVHGLDVNADLLASAREVAEEEQVSDRITFHHHLDERLPFDDSSVDRGLFKNVLCYVPDMSATVNEAYRVLRSGGSVVAIDSDSSFSVTTVLTPLEMREFMDATSAATREPNAGRYLQPTMRSAGFEDIVINVNTIVDTDGVWLPVIQTFMGYARQFGTIEPERLDEMESRSLQAIEDGTWQLILAQFHAEGTKP